MKEVGVIVELARGSTLDRNLRADTPPSVQSGRVVLDHLPPDENGRLGPPPAGQVIMSVPSPEALKRDWQEISDTVGQTDTGDQPPVIIVEAAEYLREDEVAGVLDAADLADRTVIVRILADA